jgi:hypothetical protein
MKIFSPIMEALRRGETVSFDGILLRKDAGEIRSGDLYIAERNSGPRFLTAKEVVPKGKGGYIIPTTKDYSFDIWECIKVKEA